MPPSGGRSGSRPSSSARIRSRLYVRRKQEACEEVGIAPIHHALAADTSEDELLGLVSDLNADERVTGILVQLPLPDHMDEGRVIRAITPIKDVDGFHPMSAGHLLQGEPTFVAATPAGIMEILRAYEIPLGSSSRNSSSPPASASDRPTVAAGTSSGTTKARSRSLDG